MNMQEALQRIQRNPAEFLQGSIKKEMLKFFSISFASDQIAI